MVRDNPYFVMFQSLWISDPSIYINGGWLRIIHQTNYRKETAKKSQSFQFIKVKVLLLITGATALTKISVGMVISMVLWKKKVRYG